MSNCPRIMRIIKVTFLLGIFIPFLAMAQSSNVECVTFRNMGMFCFRSEVSNSAPLLIFIRGFYQGSGRVESTAERVKAATAALETFDLNSFGRPVLVLGSSHLGINQTSMLEIEALYQKYNLGAFNQYILAAHSGGYVGLFETLREGLSFNILMPNAIIMLDNFYSVQTPNTETYHKALESGAACGGFLTTHNLDRYQRLYKNPKCTVLGPEGQNHNTSVLPTLRKFLP